MFALDHEAVVALPVDQLGLAVLKDFYDTNDVVEAAEAVQTASLLMRILDRVEKRQPSARQ
jgi:hypothetical protein